MAVSSASVRAVPHSYVNIAPVSDDGAISPDSETSRTYINIAPMSSGLSPNLETAPINPPLPHCYINVPLLGNEPNLKEHAKTTHAGPNEDSPTPLPPSNDTQPPSNSNKSTKSPLRHYHSSLYIHPSSINSSYGDTQSSHQTPNTASVSPGRDETACASEVFPSESCEQSVSDVKFELLTSGRVSSGCDRCNELNHLLAAWEIGVSGLTRNYSRILAHLMKTRDAASAMESRLKQGCARGKTLEKNSTTLGPPPSSRAPKVRQSMFVSNDEAAASIGLSGSSGRDIAENMYPHHRDVPVVPVALANEYIDTPLYTRDLSDLNIHLSEAIDLCQQLAAACFKRNYLSDGPGVIRSSSHSSPSSTRANASTPSFSSSAPYSNNKPIPGNSSYKPALQSISEGRLGDSLRKRQRSLEKSFSVPNLERSSECTSSVESDDEFVNVRMNSIPNHVTKAADHPGTSAKTDPEPDELLDEKSGYTYGEFDNDPRMSSISSTYSDNDVKFVMSKIASLEDERFKLLETIDLLKGDNARVRESLSEILGDLENKDLQLMLAMQDLIIATGEMRRAADMRKKLDSLSVEREALLEKLGDLEDESSAVKVSLIQLLQEKSATNKTLALENYRLAQRVRRHSRGGGGGSGVSSRDNISDRLPTISQVGDNVSTYSTTTEDATLQEVYMGADMSSNFVHKQGFLVKQGGRVKSWRKRLFVLNTDGLAYYKTEEPIQTVPIEKIEKVQQCHGRCPQPNMFEVHTQGRIFYLSAPSGDDMQSWVGMLETLKQYKKATTLHRAAALKLAQDNADNQACAIDRSMSSSPIPQPSVSNINSRARTTSPRKENSSTNEEEESEDEHFFMRQRVSLHVDDESDTSYLENLKIGSMPTNHGGIEDRRRIKSDLIASLDLSRQ